MPSLAASTPERLGRTQARLAALNIGIPFLCAVAALPLGLGMGISRLNLVLTACMYTLSMLGVGAGFHRFSSHRSFGCGEWLKSLLLVAGSTAGEGPLIFWVATHRAHHQFSDQASDPHSPHYPQGPFLRRLWHAHVGWMFTTEPVDPKVYALDLLKDHRSFWVHRHYLRWMGLGILAPGLVALLFDFSIATFATAVFWAGLVRVFLVQNATWSVNSLGHLFGAQPNRTRGQSRNNALLALLTLGDGWHNNHHAAPAAALHGWWKWYQLDVTGALIQLLALFGVVTAVKHGRLNDSELAPRKDSW